MEILLDDWKVCPDNLTLEHAGKVFHLEPRSMDLLIFMLQQNGKVVSRDALIEHVWNGTIVSDHAVTSCVAKIRKVFNDQENKLVIETISKRGYRINPIINVSFLENVDVSASEALTEITDTNSALRDSENIVVQRKPQLLFTYTGLVLLSGLLAFILFSQFNLTSQTSSGFVYSQVEPVTSLTGLEYNPNLSPNGMYLSYLHSPDNSNEWALHIAEKNTNRIVYKVGNVAEYSNHAWSPDSKAVLFHRYDKQQCHIFVAHLDLTQSKFREQHVTECQPHSMEIDLAWDKDKELVYFNESSSVQDPRVIFQINLKTAKKQQMTTPTEVGFGDYNPIYYGPNNSIYFLRNIYWKKETKVMRMSLDTKELISLHTIDKLLSYLALDSQGNPVYQDDSNIILLKDLRSDKEHVLYNSAKSITQPTFSKDDTSMYFVAESNSDRDISLYSMFSSAFTLANVNASLDDYAPIFANKSEKYAFMSNRTGKRQIYVNDFQGNQLLRTAFEDEANPVNLIWSKNDEALFFSQGRSIFQLDIESEKINRIDLSLEYVHLSAANEAENGFYFASDHINDWQIYQFSKGDVTQLTESGGYIAKASSDADYLFFTKFRQLGLWRKDLQSGHEEIYIENIDLSVPGSFELFDDGIIYKLKTASGFNVFKYSFETNSKTLITSLEGEAESPFSVSYDQQHILFESIAEDAKADIMKVRR
jgi:transcriptional activator of cad operon